MPRIAFPFWTLRTEDSSDCQLDREVVAFSSFERATAYLNAQLAGRGELNLVSRQSMRRLVAELQKRNLEGIRLDPAPEGTDGEQLPLAELAAEFSG
jgi:hypothetical protein